MAGTTSGAHASSVGASTRRILKLAPGTTRTRRIHGTFSLGELFASVYSSRRSDRSRVMLSVGHPAVRLDVTMTPEQAHGMARALKVAARAADAATQPTERSEVRVQAALPGQPAAKGGAA